MEEKDVLNDYSGCGHCFFSRHNKKIMFHINGRALNYTIIKSSIQSDTLAKLVEGLNHFLAYYYYTDREEYEKISLHIFKTYSDICLDKKYNLDPTNYSERQIPMLVKYCELDDYLIDKICKYVKYNSVDNINNADATTDITLNNEHTSVLACIATAIKFSYLHASLLRGIMKFEETMVEFIDPLMSNVINIAKKYFDYHDDENDNDDYNELEEMHSYIDNFIIQLVTKTWNTAADASFKRKFEETGKDTFYYARKHKLSIITAFKKYMPPAIDEETAMKYADSKDSAKKVYYTIGKDYRDFKFVAKNLAAYIQTTIKNIITRQDTKVDILDVNIPDFIIDGSDEKSIRKDVAFYEDKYKHLFDLRKKTAVAMFRQIIEELDKYDLDMSFIKRFKVGKNHTFNQVILHKCLLSLTGESRVYSETFGLYNKFLLLLFYLGVKSRPDLEFIHKTIDIMLLEPTTMQTQTDEQIEEYLAQHGVKEVSPRAFNSVLKLYSDERNQIVLSKNDFLDIYYFISSPARVRNLLFPSTYTDEEDKVELIEVPSLVENIRRKLLKEVL